ncbi:carboxypeptidase-like regulatory domain-containing protein [Tenacibaculum insulae]|uniref:carboxypeptidase-like regulatory domain-containing protein n=1 Tax=Tenacibaculum insulae TaxID=2029677 RepID=UPI003AB7D0F1
MNGKNKIQLITFCFLFLSQFLASQILIKGVVKNIKDVPLEQISILLYENDDLIDYTFTNFKGTYTFTVKSNKNYTIKTSSMSYKDQAKTIVINKKSITINFNLLEENNLLEEVVLKIDRDIEVRKDSIIFNANSFKNKRQIVLEDLLKDIPGIQVSSTGNITFQGKLVTNVKIENDDLFNGGYKILTKNLKAEIVEKVQVLKNYSKNPLLKNVRDTEDVAINITLKEDRKKLVFGDVDIHSNLEKKNNLHTNIISFLKKNKYYFIADHNNIGKDSYLDFKDIFTSKSDNPTLKIGSNQRTKIFTTLNTLRPKLDEEYVNLNESELYNFNSIFNVTPKLKIKAVFLAYKNENDFLNNTKTTFLTDSLITIDEDSKINRKEKLKTTKIDLNWKINKNSILEYNANYLITSGGGNSTIKLPNDLVNENVLIEGEKTNHFINYTKKNKDSSIIQLTSRYIYDNKPQNYTVFPFPYKNTFGDNFELAKSEILNKLSYFTTQVAYLKDFKNNNIETYLGYHNKKEHLRSQTLFKNKDTNSFSNNPPDFFNKLLLNQDLVYFKNRFRKKIKNVNLALNIDFNFENNKKSNFKTNNFFYINSNFQFKYLYLKKHEFNYQINVNQSTSSLSNLNEAPIPSNYRNFSTGLSNNKLQRDYSTRLNYIYGNWNDKFTGGFNIKYTFGDRYLSFNSVLSNEITTIENIILKGRKDFRANIYIDRYLSFLATNLKVKTSYLNTTFANKVNNTQRNINLTSLSFNIELRSNFSSFLDFHLGYNLTKNTTKVNSLKTKIFNQKSFIDFDIYFNKLIINFENDLYFFDKKSKISNYYFSNIKSSYKINSNLSIQARVHNLFNNKSFDIFSQTNFSQFNSQTKLIERYFLIGFNYRF